jgi:hypothetical protein
MPWEVHRLSGEILDRLRDYEAEPWQRLVIEDEISANMEFVPGSAEPPALFYPATRRLVWRFAAPITRSVSIRYQLRPEEVGTWPTSRRAWAEYEAGSTNDTADFPVPWVEVLEPLAPSLTPSPTPSPIASPTTSPTPTATVPSTATSTMSPVQTATYTSVPSATTTPSPTSTSEPTPTLTPTPTVPPSPQPIYLPVGLREFCPPKDLYVDVALVIDASTSMLEITAVGSTKLELAVESVGLFLDNLRLQPERDRVAIITFNDEASTLQGLTGDRAALARSLQRIHTAQQSRVDLGIERAMVELIARGNATQLQAMVVLSDGKANPVPGDEAVAAAKTAQREGITIYVVGLGPSMDERVLRGMASGDDRYVAAPDPVAIPSIYRDLTQRVACPPEVFWGGR